MFTNFFPENRAIYEVMSKNLVKPQMTICRMRFAR